VASWQASEILFKVPALYSIGKFQLPRFSAGHSPDLRLGRSFNEIQVNTEGNSLLIYLLLDFKLVLSNCNQQLHSALQFQ